MSDLLPRLPTAPQRRWILALSGGGYRGLFTAQFLARLEQEIGRPLHSVFDLIAGTSIGSILALGLAKGVPASELVDFFTREGPSIFPAPTLLQSVRRLLRAKYSSQALSDALETALVRATFDSLETRVIVPAVNLTDSGPAVFRTRNGAQPASTVPLHDAALASSAAPTYFPPHLIGTQPYVDGGLIANSPDSLALFEATAVLGWRLDSLHLLSVGTTHVESGLSSLSKPANWGLLRWGWNLQLLEQMMTAQAKLSRDTARLSLGSRYIGIDAVRGASQDRVIALDLATTAATQTLMNMADVAWERAREKDAQALQAMKLHRR